MFHAFSFTVCVLIPLYHMCHLTIIKSVQPFSKIVKALVKDKISVFVAIPLMLKAKDAHNVSERSCLNPMAMLTGLVIKIRLVIWLIC